MMNRRVTVLGAGGFLGQAVCRALLEVPVLVSVTALDRHQPTQGMLDALSIPWVTLDLDLAGETELRQLIDRLQPDVVVNCVGLTSGTPAAMRSLNVDLVAKLVATLAGRTDVRIVQIGSAAEYGMQRERYPVTEAQYAAPSSAYGVTKLEATQRLLRAARDHRLPVTVLRVFNPIGRRSPPWSLPGCAAREIRAALARGDPAVRLGDLGSSRDYVDSRDVASAVAAATADRSRGGFVLNVGRGEAVLSRDLVESLATIAGFQGKILESSGGSARSAALRWQCADITAIREHLGWVPRRSLVSSLRELWSGMESCVTR